MLKQLSYCTATFLALGAVCSAQGPQNELGRTLPPASMAWVVEGPTTTKSQHVTVADLQPLTIGENSSGRCSPQRRRRDRVSLLWDLPGAPGHDLPTQIASWLAHNFELPHVYYRPEIYVSAPVRLTALDAANYAKPPSASLASPGSVAIRIQRVAYISRMDEIPRRSADNPSSSTKWSITSKIWPA